MINKELKLKYIMSLKQGNKVPKLQTAWQKFEYKPKQINWWEQPKSRVLKEWTGDKRPKAESAEDYTKRRIKEKWRTYDFF